MRSILLFLLFIFLFYSCGYSENKRITERKNDLSEEIFKKENEYKNGIIDTIKCKQLGKIRIGENIEAVLKELEHFNVVYDSLSLQEFDEPDFEYEYFYNIYDVNNNLLFQVFPNKNKKLERIDVYSDRFVMDCGLKVGKKVSDIKEFTSINFAGFIYETGLIVRLEKVCEAFQLDINVKEAEFFDHENLNIDLIPNELPIVRIIIQ